jgi:hypothetical protein
MRWVGSGMGRKWIPESEVLGSLDTEFEAICYSAWAGSRANLGSLRSVLLTQPAHGEQKLEPVN